MEPISATSASTITTVELADRLDALEAAPLREILAGHLQLGQSRILVDLSKVDFVDSAGLAALVKNMKDARSNGGDLRLVRPEHPDAIRVFELTRFDEVFTMYDSIEAGLTSW